MCGSKKDLLILQDQATLFLIFEGSSSWKILNFQADFQRLVKIQVYGFHSQMQNNDHLFDPWYTWLTWDDWRGQWQNLLLNPGEQIS